MSFIPPQITAIQGCFKGIKKTLLGLYGTGVGSLPKICDLVSHGYSLYLQWFKGK